MGDPRKIRKKYETPMHPWVRSRIEEERGLERSYGTHNKTELYKMTSALTRFKDRAKSLVSRTDAQAVIERQHLMDRMVALGLIKPGANLDDILGLTIHNVMKRRLQTLLVEKLLARTMKQARQLITHGHVIVNDRVVTSPSYLVTVAEESMIRFKHNSPFLNEQHPERFSEAELRAKEERERAKAEKDKKPEEEAPLAFKEEEIEKVEEVVE